MIEFQRVEFLGGPMDGAVRPVPSSCDRIPLAAGAVIHCYMRDEIFDGYSMRPVMRHVQIKPAWVPYE